MLLLWISARDFRQDLQTVVTRGGINGPRSTTSSSNKAVSIRYEILLCLVSTAEVIRSSRSYLIILSREPWSASCGRAAPYFKKGFYEEESILRKNSWNGVLIETGA